MHCPTARYGFISRAGRSVSSSSSLRLPRLRDELQRDAVVAVALAGRWRAVVEDVPVMAAAARTVILGAREHDLVVRLGRERARNRGEKTRPSGAAVELHRRGEQRQAATRADEHAFALLAIERARSCALS